jgi:signal transduction histidine kinase
MNDPMPGPAQTLVLVVDDIDESRAALQARIGALGFATAGAASGAEALERVAQLGPDVVLLDLLMPGMDGFDVARALRSSLATRWLPVIAMSSLPGEIAFVRAVECGADDFLSRPIDEVLLRSKIEHHVRVGRMQSQLKEAAVRQARILDSLPDPVLTVDEHGTVVSVNQAALDVFGRGSRAPLAGRSVQAVLGVSQEVLLRSSELVLTGSDDGQIPVEVRVSEWLHDRVRHQTLVLRDLTQARRVERMKDEFIGHVSHELRTPLTSVLGALGLLAGGKAGAFPAAAQPLFEMAQRNGQRLSQLISNILDLTKLEGDRMPIHWRTVALTEVVAQARADSLALAERAGVGLDLQVAPAAADSTVIVDPDRFAQVMGNLLSNAIKHSPREGVVTLSIDREGPSVRVGVRDRGPGVAPAFRGKLFEKFSQHDPSDRRAQGGTGLGMSLSRVLVERMHGRIWLHDGTGPGALFCVELPVVEARRNARCLLVVDSDSDCRNRIRQWMAARYQVVVASRLSLVPAAMQAAGASQVDAIVADTHAQGDAQTFCVGLKRLARSATVLLYSDSVDAGFVRGLGLTWLPKMGSSQERVVQQLIGHLEPDRNGVDA